MLLFVFVVLLAIANITIQSWNVMVIFNTAMFKLLFGVTQYDVLLQNYIKNGDSSKLSSLFVQMDYIIDSVINSHDIMKSYWLTIWFTFLIYRFVILKHKIKRQTQPRGDCAGFKI